jgi:cell division septal protein FtsQ
VPYATVHGGVVVPWWTMKPRPKQKPRFREVNPATVLLVKQFLLGLSIFATIAVVVFGVRTVTRLPAFTITTITASGGSTIDERIVEEKVSAVLEGTYLKLIPRRFIYFYPAEEVKAAVASVDRIKNPQIERTDRHTLTVTYDEYYPDALWCKDKETSECLFLDGTGYAFGPAPHLTGGSLLRYYTLQDTPEIGKTVLLSEDYLAIKAFVNELGLTGWYVATVEVDAVRDVFYTLAQGGELKATLTENGADTLQYLVTLRQSAEFAHLAPGNFQYIDLRFGSKVFVNEREEIVADTATSTATGTEEQVTE